MKSLLILAFILTTSLTFAQSETDKKVFLDSLWREVPEGNHTYYRIIRDYNKNKDQYLFEEYYKSGKLKLTGKTSNKENLVRQGEFIEYYENGNKKEIKYHGQYFLEGEYKNWYENGNKKTEGEYFRYKKNDTIYPNGLKIINFWDEKNVQKAKDGNGNYSETEKDFEFSGKIENGYKQGEWKGFNNRKKYSFSEVYRNGYLINGYSIDSLGKKREYKEIRKIAEPEKGIKDFMLHIQKNTKTPSTNGPIKGRVVIEISIELNGDVKNIKVLKSLHPLLDEAAIEVIKNYNQIWSTETERGIPVKGKFLVPIMFDLK